MNFNKCPKGMKKPAIKNFGGGFTEIAGQGITRLRFEDDQGRVHTHDVQGAAYVPSAPYVILSPQHWAQQAKDNKPNLRGTSCGIYTDCAIIRWKQNKFQRTVPYDAKTNVPKFCLAPGTVHYQVTSALLEDRYNNPDKEKVCFQAAEAS
eukprot:13050567-Ditylum_brightwellii.AAC.1